MAMKPIDYRSATWAVLRASVTELRLEVLKAWCKYGPCTTEELAQRSAIPLLSIRPRTTELFQLGLVKLAEQQSKGKHRGATYAALSDAEAEQQFELTKQKLSASHAEQATLGLRSVG
jgi:predicted transcriptional regulator